MDASAAALNLLLQAGLLGLACGVLLERTHFCTMGSLTDFYLFGGTRRLKAWALAIAVALLLTQALALGGLIDLGRSRFANPIFPGRPCYWAASCSAGAWCWPAAVPAGPWSALVPAA